MVYVPIVVESTPRGERSYDLFSRLLNERIIFLSTPIVTEVAALITAQLLFLQSEDPERDIMMYINSPGGDVLAGLTIYDTMQHIKPDVATYAVGLTAPMGTFLLATGAPGKRYALPNATVHFHPASGGASGYAPDVEIHLKFLLDLQERGNRLMAQYTGQTYDQIVRDFQRDRFFTAPEAVEYGLVDRLLAGEELASYGLPVAANGRRP